MVIETQWFTDSCVQGNYSNEKRERFDCLRHEHMVYIDRDFLSYLPSLRVANESLT
jgi:hypothetical protein